MKSRHPRQEGRNAFDLIEEATHLLRTTSAATLAVYYLGTIPFVLGLLFFWADMSRSPLAADHLAGASFGVAGLYFWMKFCQALFLRRIRAQAAGVIFLMPGWRRCARMGLTQAIIQPSGLFLLLLAAPPLLPLPWVYAFYQNVAALDDGEDGVLALMKKSWRQAALWPRQNHLVLALMLAFGFCVFLNWATACLALPALGKMLLGIESDFTRSSLAMLNSTFVAALIGLTYLCVDPLLKTLFALRCFYGDSVASGGDLKAGLRPFTAAVIGVVLLLTAGSALPAAGDTTGEAPGAAVPSAASPQISPADLDRTINQTIHERKYIWRMPREQAIETNADQGLIGRFFTEVGDTIRGWASAISHWIERVLRRLFHHTPQVQTPSSGYGWIMSLHVLLYGLAAAAIAALVIFIMRVWPNRHRKPVAVTGEPVQPHPDLADENVRADQLPEDGWTRLARELLERGEFRLAMRAFYLASLAHLAARNLISIARFKSNRDYERELRRRAHSFPELLAGFGENLYVFESVWYGNHEAGGDRVREFAASLEKLKASG